MYFYVDESGNTGNHLFDENQPNLYYGMLSCRKNLDVIAEPMLASLRTKLGVERLHAAELGVARLTPILERLSVFQKKNDVRFNFYKVVKPDHAIITFFDQVFDSGTNSAVPYHCYWTPLRYPLLFKVQFLFDRTLAAQAWQARLLQNRSACEEQLCAICEELLRRLDRLPDVRSRELIGGALRWTLSNPSEIGYGATNSENALQISPNLVGFQHVLAGISGRCTSAKREVKSIIVDRQSEFNNAQGFLNDIYRKLRSTDFDMPFGMPNFDWQNMPDQDIEFRAGDQSAGLELVDIYLWVMKRMEEDKTMSPEGHRLIWNQRHRGVRDEISFAGLEKRWRFLSNLPEPDENSAASIRNHLEQVERQRLAVLASIDS